MRVLEEQPCGLITAFDRVIFAAWSAVPSNDAMAARMLDASHREAERQGKVALLVALSHGAPMPSDTVRNTIQVEMRKLDPFLICGATVIDKAGFRASALRAVVSTMQLISRPKHPEKVFASAAEAVHFIRAELQLAGVEPPLSTDLLLSYQSIVEKAQTLGTASTTSM